MGKYEKHDSKAKKLLPYVCGAVIALVLVAIVLVVFASLDHDDSSGQPTVQTYDSQIPGNQALILEGTEEQGDNVVIYTSYCTLKYPYAFSDIMQVEAVTMGNDKRLEFTAHINDIEAKLFDLCFHSGEGTLFGTLQLEGESVPVSVVIYEADPALDGENLNTFYAAQELVNEITVSLTENEGFTQEA